VIQNVLKKGHPLRRMPFFISRHSKPIALTTFQRIPTNVFDAQSGRRYSALMPGQQGSQPDRAIVNGSDPQTLSGEIAVFTPEFQTAVGTDSVSSPSYQGFPGVFTDRFD
jgi:hypothetical protein